MRRGLRHGFFEGRGDRHEWGGLRELLRGPAPRADRGTVRYLVLDALKDESRHGYEILRVVGEKSGGVYRPSPGVVYPTLQLLEELGLVQLAPRAERKVYAITEAGRAELKEHADEVTEFYESTSDQGFEGQGDDLRNLAMRLRRLLHLFRRTLRQGRLGPAKARRVRAVLDQAIERLEELLEDA
ncbi:MAG TPA: PadR family transcriptional regulator [Myxococcales bacterium]|nr:PadR family transcriptional regulator [Myxococcales bacterium]